MNDGHATPTPSARQTRRATASGWIGSALEYYDFFIYAQAAAMVFPHGNPNYVPQPHAHTSVVGDCGT